jgi:hypothetical protein
MEKSKADNKMDEDNIMIESYDNVEDHEINIDEIAKPSDLVKSVDFRRISVPQHRMTPLRANWETIVKTIVERLKLQIRMNTGKKCVEIRTVPGDCRQDEYSKSCRFYEGLPFGLQLERRDCNAAFG